MAQSGPVLTVTAVFGDEETTLLAQLQWRPLPRMVAA